jgi:hypothetical protein
METANGPPLESEYAEKKYRYYICDRFDPRLSTDYLAQLSLRKMGQSGFAPRKGSTTIESAAEAAQLPSDPPYSLNGPDAGVRSQWRLMTAKRNWRGLATKQRNTQGHAEGGYATRASDHRPDLIILILATLALAVENRPLHGPWPSQYTASRILKQLGW